MLLQNDPKNNLMKSKILYCSILFIFSVHYSFAQTSLDIYSGIQSSRFDGRYLTKINGGITQPILLTPVFGLRLVKKASKVNWLNYGLGLSYNKRNMESSSVLHFSLATDRYQATYKSHGISISGIVGVEFLPHESFSPYLNTGLFIQGNLDNKYSGNSSSDWVNFTTGELIHSSSFSDDPEGHMKNIESGFLINPGVIYQLNNSLSVLFELECGRNMGKVRKSTSNIVQLSNFENGIHYYGLRLGLRVALGAKTVSND